MATKEPYMFLTANKEKAFEAYAKTLDSFNSIKASSSNYDLTNDVKTRVQFTKSDYDYYRPYEALPTQFKEIVKACRSTYHRSGIVRNVINLMIDFACEDIKLVHPSAKAEAFFNVWASKVRLAEKSEEFAKHLLIDSNVVVKRVTGKLTKPVDNTWQEEIVAAPDVKLYVDKKNIHKDEIPIRYLFLNLVQLDWTHTDIERMSGIRKLSLNLSTQIANSLRSAKPEVLAQLPQDIRDRLKNNTAGLKIPLDMDKLFIAHDKKDSWDDWAIPFLYGVLADLNYKDKLRQAEVSALDGVINVIRIWKLGDHTKDILPTAAAVDKLLGILETNTGGGALDIVWDSMIEMDEHYPPVEKILGSEKYVQVNKDILTDLGVPEVLIGGAGANFSNSWIQLKTLIEKLESVRFKISEWINTETDIICQSLDIPVRPQVRFNNMNLQDENVAKKLILGLFDRGIVSAEAVLNIYGEDIKLEVDRIRREKKDFKTAGIEIVNPLKRDSSGENGRPPLSKDTSKRTDRKANPRTSAMLFADKAIEAIDTYIVPQYMANLGTNDARKLTSEQKDEINNLRIFSLSCIKYGDDLNKDKLQELTASLETNVDLSVVKEFNKQMAEYIETEGKEPNLETRKKLEAISWSNIHGE